MGSTSGKFTSPGTSTFVLPYGARINSVNCWAGGGAGASMTNGAGGGGGGGAYAEQTTSYYNLGSASIRIIVGNGGNSSSVNGENSSVAFQRVGEISYTIIAEAGGGIGCIAESNSGESGGSVITGRGYSGGTGASANSSTSGGGGGGAGDSQTGGNASGGSPGVGGTNGGGYGGTGVTGDTDGNNGTSYGGGGSGAITSGRGRTGGSGAAGAVYVQIEWPDNVQLMILTDSEVTSYVPPISEMILNGGANGQSSFTDSNSDGLADYWSGNPDNATYTIVNDAQSVSADNGIGYLYSNDFMVTDALEHTYSLEFTYDTANCTSDVKVYVWANGSPEDIITTLPANGAQSFTAIANYQITSGDDFNGIMFEVQNSNTFVLSRASCIKD